MKDYYTILECTPMSTIADIKKQYRKLAQQYHPDKNPHDPYAAAAFHDVKEAYETLTQPARKEAWLQERWLHQVHHIQSAATDPLTPHVILKTLIKLDRQIATMDVYRMDQIGCALELIELISNENLNCLLTFREEEINHTIIQHMLVCTRPLRYNVLHPIWPQLEELAQGDAPMLLLISQIRQEKRRKHQQEKWTAPLVFLVTLLLCAMIFWVSR